MKTWKIILPVTAMLILPLMAKSQCVITATANPIEICLGQSVTLTSAGQGGTYLMNNDFNNGLIGSGWDANCTPMFSNPCGANPNGTTYCWVGSAACFPRELKTVSYNVTSACQICFDLRFSNQGDSSPCEGPDEMDEGVSLQYSTNGTTWTTIVYFAPDGNQYPSNTWIGGSTAGGGSGTPFNTWANYCFNVPPGGASGTTQFRWYQDQVTSQSYDHWGIDEVEIFCPPPNQTVVWTANGTQFYNDFNPPLQTPSVTTDYNVTISDGICSADTTMQVIVYQPVSPTIAGLDPSYCVTGTSSNLTGSPAGGTFSGPGMTGSTFSPAAAGVGTHTITYTWNQLSTGGAVLCTFSTTAQTTVISQPTSDFSVITPICPNDPSTITYQGNAGGTASYTWDFNGATILSGGGAGPYTITWGTSNTYTVSLTVTQNGCVSPPTNHQIVVLSATDPACCAIGSPNAGSDNQVCALTYNLNASGTSTGSWHSLPAGANFVNTNAPNTNVSVPAPGGLYTFVWTDGLNPGCQSWDTVIIRFTPQPVAEAGTGGTFCLMNGTLNATASVGTGTWTANPAAGVTITNVNSPVTNVSVTTDGNYVFTWTEDNGFGCSSTDQVSFGFYDQPVANAGPDDAVCLLNYTMQAVASLGTGTWSAVGPGSAVFTDIHSPTTAVYVNVSGTYNFIWTEVNNNCNDKDTVVVSLTQVPTSTFDAPDVNCFGDNASITYTGNGTPAYIYTWDFGGGTAVPGTGIGPHSVSYAAAGLYTVSLQVTLNGCTSPVTTNTLNVPTELTASVVGTNILCHGAFTGQVNLTVGGGTPFPSGFYSYAWTNGYLSEDLINVPAATYSVVVTDAQGCTATAGTTVNEPAQLSVYVTPSFTICPGEDAFLTLYPIGGTFPYQYYWNNNLNPTSTISVSPSATTTYTGYATDANSCVSNVAVTTISVAPPLVMNAYQNTDSICPGEPVLFTTSVTGGIGPPYQFFDELGNVLVPPMYQYPAGTTTYVIIAQDACGLSDSDTLTINVLPQPPVTFYPDVTSGCQPLLVNFVESNPDLGQTYLWDFGDNANLSLDKNPSHLYDDYGLFDVTVTVTSVDGCKTTVSVQDLIDVWPKPLAAYTWNPEFGTIIKPIIDFTNHTQFGSQYVWTFGDGDSSSFMNPYHRFPDAGNWPVSLIAISDKGCRDTVTYYIIIQDEFSFYAPTAFSPDNDLVNDVFYFSGHGVDAETFYCAIYNRWGELIWESNQWSDDNPEQYGWDGRTKNGSLVEIGTYTWYVELRDFKQIRHIFSGAITVVR